MESRIPCPPEVPGSKALMKAEDYCKTSFIIRGLPEIRIEIKGISEFIDFN